MVDFDLQNTNFEEIISFRKTVPNGPNFNRLTLYVDVNSRAVPRDSAALLV